ncbi:uncharacterized protein Z519_01849 [Cladophialophora bantiana CBS 173.52]|uniref:Transcription factor domain-containing protein n=1 Tax=Cladophialophora bantiana (strain ATCC 10958 / CBS 173.52 / CDC B-1940 / NIH 8579) TaxID=1442370 RepID=A0A0D2I4R1_CLAB1|nr:uncharacterized protein Z519_01849 [Cladophialophora bantiana CBS 173.52]KIW98265.1 hypothetical protein Z519_01849 [Cladophialophora bantiana CBS 173.52]
MACGSGLHLGRELHLKLYHDAQDQCSTTIKSVDYAAKGLLEDAFWTQANIYPPLLRKNQIVPGTEDYSLTLHLAALALGLRHADCRRSELANFRSEGRESSLHRLLRTVIDSQISAADTLDVLQAVVILSNLEYSSGRYLSATSYLHYACVRISKPANDVISHELSFSDNDVLLRRAVLRTCEFLQMQWMVFLPETLSGLHIPPAVTARLSHNSKTIHSWVKYGGTNDTFSIYHALLDLLAVVLSITQISAPPADSYHETVFAQLCKLETRQAHFRRTIPERFQWRKDTWRTASVPMFLLHLQFCVVSVLLYGRLAQAAKLNCIDKLPHSLDETLGRYYGRLKRGADKLACSIPRFFERFDTHFAPATMVIQLGVALNALLDVGNTYGVKEQTAILPGLKSCVTALDKLSQQHKLARDLTSLAGKHLTSLQSLVERASKSSVLGPGENNSFPGDAARSWQSASPPELTISDPLANAARHDTSTVKAQTGPPFTITSSAPRVQSAEMPKPMIWISQAAVIEDPIFPAYSREILALFNMYSNEKNDKPVESSLEPRISWRANDTHEWHRRISQRDIPEKVASPTFIASDPQMSISPPNPIGGQGPTSGNVSQPPGLPATGDNDNEFSDPAVLGSHNFDVDAFCSAMNCQDFSQPMDWIPELDFDSWIDLPVPDVPVPPIFGEMGTHTRN